MPESRGIIKRKLHFEVQVKQGQRSDYLPSVIAPKKYPCFILVFNDNWNDYSQYHTWFSLFYFKGPSDNDKLFIGELKMMCTEGDNTYEQLEESFDYPLDDTFCSLGLDTSYYQRMHEKLGDIDLIKEVQNYLGDCTFLPELYELHKDSEPFMYSLLRDFSALDAFDMGQPLSMGVNPDDLYSFDYTYRPVYDTSLFTKWKVRFLYNAPSYLRSCAIIGENGVGKTQLLKSFLLHLLQDKGEEVSRDPQFKSILAICSTPFDDYPEDEDTLQIKYYKFSTEQNKDGLIYQLQKAIQLIDKRPTVDGKSLIRVWSELIADHVDKKMLEGIVTWVHDDDLGYERTILNFDGFSDRIGILSSGQLHIFVLLTFLCTHIHFRSLVVLDEPEVHLHPHIIMHFMAVLSDILSTFKSYALIATHSPLIIREIAGKNVYRMQKVEGNVPQISKVPFETMGEDVTSLYHHIFEYDRTDSHFMNVVRQYIEDGLEYDDIVEELGKHIKLTLNARLIIRDMVGNNH